VPGLAGLGVWNQWVREERGEVVPVGECGVSGGPGRESGGGGVGAVGGVRVAGVGCGARQ
jgi:hypothetical protein